MHHLSLKHLTNLRSNQKFPCISLYQPTHRHLPDSLKDQICYRNLLREMESSLNEKYSTEQVHSAMKKFQQLAHDEIFWHHRTEGLAILSSPETFNIFDLQRPVSQLLVVAETFHTKPLLRILQSADRYQLLCLTRNKAKLYEGNRDSLNQVELKNVPSTITEALGSELTEPHLTVASYGTGIGGGNNAMHHGHGGKRDEIEIDTDRFFRVIDRAILEHHSRPSGLPLLLVALPEHQATFRGLTHNKLLLEKGLSKNPESLSAPELCKEAWQEIEPTYLQRLAERIEFYQSSRSEKHGSDNIEQVAEATMAGRVAALLVEADRQVPGRVDAAGKIEPGEFSNPEVGDILDDLAELVLQMNGEVTVVPKERMPSQTGLAATFRY